MQKSWKSGRHGKNIILTILEIFYPFGAYYILYPLDNLTQQRQTPPVDHWVSVVFPPKTIKNRQFP